MGDTCGNCAYCGRKVAAGLCNFYCNCAVEILQSRTVRQYANDDLEVIVMKGAEVTFCHTLCTNWRIPRKKKINSQPPGLLRTRHLPNTKQPYEPLYRDIWCLSNKLHYIVMCFLRNATIIHVGFRTRFHLGCSKQRKPLNKWIGLQWSDPPHPRKPATGFNSI